MKIQYLIIITFLISIFSCTEELNINRDPDLLSPDQVPLNFEMPSAMSGVAASSGSYFAIIGGMWSQFYTQSSLANQYKYIDDYSLGTNDVNGAWSSMYDALLDAKNVKNNAEKVENWNYYLIATVIESYGFQLLTDMYGDVPVQEALDPEKLNPVYDQASVIYGHLIYNLEEALSKDFANSNTEIIPGADDLIFEGDMDKWKQFANTLLLKLYLRQSNSNPGTAQSGVQALYSNGTQFLSTDAAIKSYVDAPDRSNPLYETNVRQLNVGTNLRTSTTLHSYLSANSDTRLDMYYSAGGSLDQGDFNNASAGTASGVAIMNPTDPVYFISEAESYFLQAEADLRYNGGSQAQNLYEMGVLAAFNQFGLDGSSFISGVYAYPNGSFDENLEAIITQKWISFFPGKGYESFIEQNRTQIPAYSPVPASNAAYVPGQWTYAVNGVTGNGNFPKRIVYPQSESQTNSNFPGLEPITAPIWYDANY